MKKITALLPITLLLLSSCSGVNDKVAIKCKTDFTITAGVAPRSTGTSVENLLIDYKDGKVFSYDDDNMVEMKNVSISPSKISFMQPYHDYGSTTIDRNTLTIATDETKVLYGTHTSSVPGMSFNTDVSINTSGKGICSKTSLPNLSSSGKKI